MRRRTLRHWLAAALVAAAPASGQIVISGKVTAEGGQPLAGAAVELLPVRARFQAGLDALEGRVEPEPNASAATDDDGLFELAVPEPGLWAVRASAPGFVPMLARLDPLAEEIALPAVELKPGRRVAALVRAPDGAPLPGALVIARSRSEEILWARRAQHSRRYWFRVSHRGVADREGRVLVDRAEGETLEVRAFAPGLLPASALLSSAGRIELALEAGRPATIEVTEGGGRPAAGVLVSVGSYRWPAGLTDENGRLETRVADSATLSALSPDGARGEARVEETQRTVALVLSEPRVLQGTVLDDESREPVAEALVWSSSGERRLARTDAGGRFSLPVWPQRDRIFVGAVAAGYFMTGSNPLTAERDPVLTLTAAASVSGEVVDARGEPVVGAAVSALPVRDGRRRLRMPRLGPAGRSRADGSFRAALVPGVSTELRITATGFAPSTRRLDPLEAHQSVTGLRLVLGRGAGLRGRLIGDGQPAVGAEIGLYREPDSSSPMEFISRHRQGAELTATSDDEGLFALDNLAAGRYLLRATAPGFAPLALPGVQVTEDGETDLGTLELERGAEITGIVVDDTDRPVEGAEVLVDSRDSQTISSMMRLTGEWGPQAVTGADGRFVVTERRRGERVDISVTHRELRPGHAASVMVPNDTPLRIVLERGARISGTVVDPAGSAVKDARIFVSSDEPGPPDPVTYPRHPGRTPGSTDQNGRFQIDGAPSGRIRVIASARGWLSAEIAGLEVPSGGQLDGLQLVLQRGATVTGTVLDGDGSPAVGAMITVQSRSHAGPRSLMLHASTDGDGRYTLEGVEPGLRTIIAESTLTDRVAREIDVQPGVNRLDLRFPSGITVSGRVVDGGGSPVAGAVVTLRDEARASPPPETRSRGDGSFTLERVRDGSYDLQASRAGYAHTTSNQLVRVSGSPISDLEIRLVTGGAITGELIGLDATQRAMVAIVATSADRYYAVGQVEHGGGYRIPDLAAGEWTVQAMVPEGPRARGKVTLEPGGDEAYLDLDFSSGLLLTGVVLRNGEPAAGLLVLLQGGDLAGWARSTTDSEGRFRIQGLDPRSYRLQVLDMGGLEHRESVELDSDTEIVVQLSTGGVAGHVLDAGDLRPVADAAISLQRHDGAVGAWLELGFQNRTTDSEGRFALPVVVAGDYRLRVVREGYAPAWQQISVPPGGELAGIEIRLEPSSGLSLQVLGPTGTPASQIDFAVLDATRRPVAGGSRTADEDGRVRLSTVPDGSFELLLSTPGSAVRTVQVTAPGPEVIVQLEPGCELEVSVAALADAVVVATLRITSSDGWSFIGPQWGSVTQEWRLGLGTRTIGGLPAGSYTVEVLATDGRSWQGQVTVAPGPNRLEL